MPFITIHKDRLGSTVDYLAEDDPSVRLAKTVLAGGGNGILVCVHACHACHACGLGMNFHRRQNNPRKNKENSGNIIRYIRTHLHGAYERTIVGIVSSEWWFKAFFSLRPGLKVMSRDGWQYRGRGYLFWDSPLGKLRNYNDPTFSNFGVGLHPLWDTDVW